MSNDKTAEEILRMNASVPKPQIEGVINAMHEYSAQQLKEYRERIEFLEQRIAGLLADRKDKAPF